MSGHDALYHRLFSNPKMVSELLLGFVDEPWIASLDLDRMQRVNAKHIARGGRRRDGDIVWRIPLKAGGAAYLLLMLEFQSKPDRWMAVRILVYAGLLWEQIAKETRQPRGAKLPPIFPVVLYNGNPRWLSPDALADLIDLPPDSALWAWQPALRYLVIDEGRYPERELQRRETLAALLFRLENAAAPGQAPGLVNDLIEWFNQHEGFDALRSEFAAMVRRVLTPPAGLMDGERVTEDLEEVRTMLVNRVVEWQAQWKKEGIRAGRKLGMQEGLQKGLERGLKQGQTEGQAAVLSRLLERRFGPLSDATRQRIASAKNRQLERWSLRLLDAASIDDVFA